MPPKQQRKPRLLMLRKQVKPNLILWWAIQIILLLTACAHLLSYLNPNLIKLYPVSVLLFLAGGFCLIVTGFIDNRYLQGRTIHLVQLLLEKSIPLYLKIVFVIVFIYMLIIIGYRLTKLGATLEIPTSKALEVQFLTGFTFLTGLLELLILYPPPKGKKSVR